MKVKVTHIILLAVCIPILLTFILSILLYVPSFQQFAVQKATSYASAATGMNIQIGNIRLKFPLTLSIRQVTVTPDSLPADTLLSLGELYLQVRVQPLLSREVLIERVGVNEVHIDTKDLLPGMSVVGSVGNFDAKADRINLASEHATLNHLSLSDATLTLVLTDTTSTADTTATAPLGWIFDIRNVHIAHTALALQMPHDTLRVAGYIGEARMQGGTVDLGKTAYGMELFQLSGTSLQYDANDTLPQTGFDASHIALTEVALSLQDIYYDSTRIVGSLKELMLKERSGLQITHAHAEVVGDDISLSLPDFRLETEYSQLTANLSLLYAALEQQPEGTMDINLEGKIGMEDIQTLTSIANETRIHSLSDSLFYDSLMPYPSSDAYFALELTMKYNTEQVSIKHLNLSMPHAFNALITGDIVEPMDSFRRHGNIDFQLHTGDLMPLMRLLPSDAMTGITLPDSMYLGGNARVIGSRFDTQLSFQESEGQVQLQAMYDMQEQAYHVQLDVDSLVLTHFLPNDSLCSVSATLQAEGRGIDPFDSLTYSQIDGRIHNVYYGMMHLSDINLNASLENAHANIKLISNDPSVRMNTTLRAQLNKRHVKGWLSTDVEQLDFMGLHLSEKPFNTAFRLTLDAESDLEEKHKADLSLKDWSVMMDKQTVHPNTLDLHVHTDVDTVHLSFQAGDLSLRLDGDAGIGKLSQVLSQLNEEVHTQLEKDSTIRLTALRPLLPTMHFNMEAAKDNPLYAIAQLYNLDFRKLSLDAYTSPMSGLQMDATTYQLLRDTFLIDTVQVRIWEDTMGLCYDADIVKTKYRQQSPFSVSIAGQLQTGVVDALLQFKNGQGETGILLGAKIGKEEQGGMRIHFFPENPILAFNQFTLNPDNYILIRNAKDIKADFLLQNDEGTFLDIKSNKNTEGYPDVNVTLGQVNLEEIYKGFSAYLPDISGMFNADIQYMPSDSSYTLTAGFNIDSLYYEGGRVGDLLFSAVYLPLAENEHQVDMHLFRDSKEILNSFVYYQNGEKENIEGTFTMDSLPLPMLNPFIPDGMAQLSGDLLGEINISGTMASPDIQGFIKLDSADIFLVPANTNIKFEPKNIEIHDNQVWFNKYSIYANGENPFVIDGTIDFTEPSAMSANLNLSAQNMQLLNTKREKNSLVYGKMLVNFSSSIRGPLNALVMRGDLDLLGGTNFTYVLQDSPLTVQDRLSGLVTFISFEEDTLFRRRTKPAAMPLGGMDMLMTIHIDQAVQVNVDLTPDQSSHVNLEGGGDLSFQYTPMGDMFLNGRYTLSSGTIKYTLPVIPLKEFNVENGSYVQWNGNPMDPTMYITATERIRTSVTLDDQSTRMVNFDVGIELSQQLENLGLRFILEAPEDATMQEQLARMDEEERAKQAVSMLVTGMYLGSNTTTGKSNLDMGDALNSFLQNEINNIAGSALKSVDINFGMESYDENGDGNKRTDYSFRFAKRFYNDRIRIVLGGRISTGADINQGQAQPFIDNVSVEYRLDPSGTRYVKVFHNKDYESLLEGELTETGAGIVLHKKMQHMRELFIFKRNRTKPVQNNEEEEKDEKEE